MFFYSELTCLLVALATSIVLSNSCNPFTLLDHAIRSMYALTSLLLALQTPNLFYSCLYSQHLKEIIHMFLLKQRLHKFSTNLRAVVGLPW